MSRMEQAVFCPVVDVEMLGVSLLLYRLRLSVSECRQKQTLGTADDASKPFCRPDLRRLETSPWRQEQHVSRHLRLCHTKWYMYMRTCGPMICTRFNSTGMTRVSTWSSDTPHLTSIWRHYWVGSRFTCVRYTTICSHQYKSRPLTEIPAMSPCSALLTLPLQSASFTPSRYHVCSLCAEQAKYSSFVSSQPRIKDHTEASSRPQMRWRQ